MLLYYAFAAMIMLVCMYAQSIIKYIYNGKFSEKLYVVVGVDLKPPKKVSLAKK